MWDHVRYMTERQQKRRTAELCEVPRPESPPRVGRSGWIAVQADDHIVAYPALFVPRPSMEEIYRAAYQKNPNARPLQARGPSGRFVKQRPCDTGGSDGEWHG